MLPTVEGTVVQQPYGVQPVIPMGTVVQQPYVAQPMQPMQIQQPMAVAQPTAYGAAAAVPYAAVPTPVAVAPQAPTSTSMNRGPSQRKFPAALASHQGQALVPTCVCCCPCGVCLHPLLICPFCWTDLGLGPASKAQRLTWDDGRNHLYLEDSCGQHVNISNDKLQVNTKVTGFCCGGCPPEENKNAFDFDPAEGVIKVRGAPHLALGAGGDGKLVLVGADNHARLVFM